MRWKILNDLFCPVNFQLINASIKICKRIQLWNIFIEFC